MIEKLKLLIAEWEANEKYMNGEYDNPLDRAVGQAYGECAEMLREIVEAEVAG